MRIPRAVITLEMPIPQPAESAWHEDPAGRAGGGVDMDAAVTAADQQVERRRLCRIAFEIVQGIHCVVVPDVDATLLLQMQEFFGSIAIQIGREPVWG